MKGTCIMMVKFYRGKFLFLVRSSNRSLFRTSLFSYVASSKVSRRIIALTGHASSQNPQKIQRKASSSYVFGYLRCVSSSAPSMEMHCEGHTLAHNPQATHFSRPSFPNCNSGSPRNRVESFGRSSGYGIVAQVFGLRNRLRVSAKPFNKGKIILSFYYHDKSSD